MILDLPLTRLTASFLGISLVYFNMSITFWTLKDASICHSIALSYGSTVYQLLAASLNDFITKEMLTGDDRPFLSFLFSFRFLFSFKRAMVVHLLMFCVIFLEKSGVLVQVGVS